MRPQPTYLYRAFCVHGGLLYVGITTDYQRRLRQHAFGSEWWADTSRVTVARYRTRWAAARAERYVIEHQNPLHNIAGLPMLPSDEERRVVVDPMLPGVVIVDGPA